MKLTYTVEEAAKLLGVSRGLIYAQIRSGELKAIELGRRKLVTKAVLEQLLGQSLDGTTSRQDDDDVNGVL
jgi:excisionase family DNA binding protein